MKAHRVLFAGALACAALFAVTSTVQAEDLDASFKAAVDGSTQTGKIAIASKNAAPYVALYADDAWVMPPNEPILKDRKAILASWQGAMDKGAFEGLSWWPTRTERVGEMGAEYGEWNVKDGDGKVTATGKYLAVWKQDDCRHLEFQRSRARSQVARWLQDYLRCSFLMGVVIPNRPVARK